MKNCSGHWQKWVLLIAFLIIVCLVIFLIMNNQNNSSITVVPGKSDKKAPAITERKGLKEPNDLARKKQAQLWHKEWLEAAQSIIEQANDPTVNEIYEFIIKNSVLCYLYERGYILVDDPKNVEHWFVLAPLFDYAENIPELKDLFSTNAAGYFLPYNRTLVIRENPRFSKIWRGVLILHEGYHVKAHFTNPLDWNNPRIFCEQEVAAHSFQNRLMKKIGGELYQQCLQKELENIQNTAVFENGVLQNFANTKGYDSRLDEVFGASLSEYESKMRQAHIWFAATFDFLDKTTPNPYERKVQFLYTIYAADGMF